ncbi:MAG: glycosyltransferase [Bacteroidetes bacterium]|nr:glycosyltransferase [Bacteroidota bacterium]
MKYSLIIAVYDRLDEVKELLASAEDLVFPRKEFEILFVDDGSKDGFKEYIEAYVSPSSLNLRAIYQENKGPGEARNNGMANSQAAYFIFVDSDCMFPKEWLQKIDEALVANAWDAFGGPDTAHSSFPPLLQAINYSMTSFLGTGGTRGSKKSLAKFYPRSFNMGIRREVFEKIGGMNRLRHGQDMDFSARIYKAGFKVGLIADAFVYHKRRTSLKKFFKQIFNWGVARINLAFSHPEMLKPIHFIPTFLVLGYLFLGLLSNISPFFHSLWQVLILAHLGVCILAFVQAFSISKQLIVALYAIITLNIQVFAYGLGMLYALLQKLRGTEEAKGFVKNYYGKKKS